MVFLERLFKTDIVSLKQIINRIPLLKYRYFGSSPSDYVPNLHNDLFAIINTQPSNRQDERWILIAKFWQEMYFADTFGRKKYRFLKQPKKQMMPAQLQSHRNACGFYNIYAAFYLFKICQEICLSSWFYYILCFKLADYRF